MAAIVQPAGTGRGARPAPGAKALERNRHLDVVRGVALAHGQDRQPRLGARLHPRPHLERRLQARARLPLAAAARLDACEQALVVAGIVGDVAAAAQDGQDGLGQVHRQLARDDVEGGRAAGRQDDRRAGEQTLAIAGDRQRPSRAASARRRSSASCAESPLICSPS